MLLANLTNRGATPALENTLSFAESRHRMLQRISRIGRRLATRPSSWTHERFKKRFDAPWMRKVAMLPSRLWYPGRISFAPVPMGGCE